MPKDEEVDHVWVRSKLQKYGEIEFITIPRYSTRKHKGFAFVEFVYLEDMRKCLAEIGTKEYGSLNPFPKLGTKDMQRMEKALYNMGK